MNEYREKIREYIAAHRDEIVGTLKDLVAIPSVLGEPTSRAPYGQKCADVLEATGKLYERYGFQTEICHEGGYVLSYFGNGSRCIGLFAHGDVVPADRNWRYTDPFAATEKDGCLFGRGVLDDKVAIVQSLYCARILKELAIPFRSRLVMYTGANEEAGMGDIKHYRKTHIPPDFSFIGDAGFPLYRGDKGIFRFTVTQRSPMESVTEFFGGKAFNIILGEAHATVNGNRITATGISHHAAKPEGAINAGQVLADKILEVPELTVRDAEIIRWIRDLLGDFYGNILGIANEDPVFGRLTIANGIIKMQDGKITLSFDMRYGMAVDIEATQESIRRYFDTHGWDMDIVCDERPFAVPADDPCLIRCLDTYCMCTGKTEAEPRINAGGTYARFLPRAIEIGTSTRYGTTLPMPNGHGSAHQPDEYIRIDGMLEAIEWILLMMLACDEELNNESNDL